MAIQASSPIQVPASAIYKGLSFKNQEMVDVRTYNQRLYVCVNGYAIRSFDMSDKKESEKAYHFSDCIETGIAYGQFGKTLADFQITDALCGKYFIGVRDIINSSDALFIMNFKGQSFEYRFNNDNSIGANPKNAAWEMVFRIYYALYKPTGNSTYCKRMQEAYVKATNNKTSTLNQILEWGKGRIQAVQQYFESPNEVFQTRLSKRFSDWYKKNAGTINYACSSDEQKLAHKDMIFTYFKRLTKGKCFDGDKSGIDAEISKIWGGIESELSKFSLELALNTSIDHYVDNWRFLDDSFPDSRDFIAKRLRLDGATCDKARKSIANLAASAKNDILRRIRSGEITALSDLGEAINLGLKQKVAGNVELTRLHNEFVKLKEKAWGMFYEWCNSGQLRFTGPAGEIFNKYHKELNPAYQEGGVIWKFFVGRVISGINSGAIFDKKTLTEGWPKISKELDAERAKEVVKIVASEIQEQNRAAPPAAPSMIQTFEKLKSVPLFWEQKITLRELRMLAKENPALQALLLKIGNKPGVAETQLVTIHRMIYSPDSESEKEMREQKYCVLTVIEYVDSGISRFMEVGGEGKTFDSLKEYVDERPGLYLRRMDDGSIKPDGRGKTTWEIAKPWLDTAAIVVTVVASGVIIIGTGGLAAPAVAAAAVAMAPAAGALLTISGAYFSGSAAAEVSNEVMNGTFDMGSLKTLGNVGMVVGGAVPGVSAALKLANATGKTVRVALTFSTIVGFTGNITAVGAFSAEQLKVMGEIAISTDMSEKDKEIALLMALAQFAGNAGLVLLTHKAGLAAKEGVRTEIPSTEALEKSLTPGGRTAFGRIMGKVNAQLESAWGALKNRDTFKSVQDFCKRYGAKGLDYLAEQSRTNARLRKNLIVFCYKNRIPLPRIIYGALACLMTPVELRSMSGPEAVTALLSFPSLSSTIPERLFSLIRTMNGQMKDIDGYYDLMIDALNTGAPGEILEAAQIGIHERLRYLGEHTGGMSPKEKEWVNTGAGITRTKGSLTSDELCEIADRIDFKSKRLRSADPNIEAVESKCAEIEENKTNMRYANSLLGDPKSLAAVRYTLSRIKSGDIPVSSLSMKNILHRAAIELALREQNGISTWKDFPFEKLFFFARRNQAMEIEEVQAAKFMDPVKEWAKVGANQSEAQAFLQEGIRPCHKASEAKEPGLKELDPPVGDKEWEIKIWGRDKEFAKRRMYGQKDKDGVIIFADGSDKHL